MKGAAEARCKRLGRGFAIFVGRLVRMTRGKPGQQKIVRDNDRQAGGQVRQLVGKFARRMVFHDWKCDLRRASPL